MQKAYHFNIIFGHFYSEPIITNSNPEITWISLNFFDTRYLCQEINSLHLTYQIQKTLLDI